MVRDQEKCIIFCQLPATTILLIAIFRILHIPCVTLAAYQKDSERDSVQDAFNQDTESAMILITTYAVGATGLNLQERCRHIHIFECAHNLGIYRQAVGRGVRIGNPYPLVYLMEYFVANTFDDATIRRNVDKALPQAMAEINRRIFNNADDVDRHATVDLGDFVMEGNCMVPLEEAQTQGLQIMEPEDVLRHLLMERKGEFVHVR